MGDGGGARLPPGLILDPSRLLQGWRPGGVVRPGELSPSTPIRSTMTADTSIPEKVRSSRGDQRTP